MNRCGPWREASRTGWRLVSLKGPKAPPVTADTTMKICDGIQRLLQRLSLLYRCSGVLVMELCSGRHGYSGTVVHLLLWRLWQLVAGNSDGRLSSDVLEGSGQLPEACV